MKRFLYFFFGAILLIVLIALIWAAKTHEETLRSLPTVLARDFCPFLQGGIYDVNIGDIERHVKLLKEEYPYIEEIVVRKMGADSEFITVYPFFNAIDPPLGSDSYISQAVIDEDQTIGAIYIKINAFLSRLFKAAILGSMTAFLLISFIGLYTIRSKSEEVRKTTSLLEEKQRELIRLERLALVGQVTANLLHDLKKPILNIRAEAEGLADEEIRRTILEEADLFLNLVRDLRLETFLRPEPERAEFVDLNEIIVRSLRLVKYAQEHVAVHLHLPDSLPFIFGQRHQLIQVFSNVLLNAFQALEGQGVIYVNASQIEEEDERQLEISIIDDGPGMPYEVLSHIFEPFYSTHRETESTGLGLYITKSIVEGMGGTLSAHSIPKHGTTFTIRFPISAAEHVE
ncbi:MAG: hypothetical protein C4527_19590 [Candidatus Omnitrophota bacterium]|jgi:signal transduction histidine kinase|nr:MAG: hypothetical protein C4527_19590 [Candidatus Omnitrophota bacterium]